MRGSHTTIAISAAVLLAIGISGCAGEPEPEFEIIDMGAAPSEPTPPGTSLAIGDTAWILEDDTAEIVGATVREVRELDPESIEGFTDDPELADLIPYAIVTQLDAPSGSAGIDVLPIDESGEITGWLGSTIGNAPMGDANACGITLPDPTDSLVQLECFVALSDGAPIVGAVYNGTSRSALFADDQHPYAAAPITWR